MSLLNLTPPIGLDGLSGPETLASLGPPQEPERGLIGQLLYDLGRDVYGTARVGAAGGSELLSLIGVNLPFTWDDIESRDIKGAMMMAALGAGGWAGGVARGALGVGQSALGRAGITTAAEAVSGAAFGLIRPLDEDEERLRALLGDAAFAGAVGAGASLMRSAVMGVVGGKIAAIKAAGARAKFAQANMLTQDTVRAQELAGIQLLNPVSGERMVIRQELDGSVVGIVKSGRRNVRELKPEQLGNDFGIAITQAFKDGFTAELNVWNPERSLKGLTTPLSKDVMAIIDKHAGNIHEAIGPMQIQRYAAVRDAAAMNTEVKAILESLGAEVVVPGAGELVPIALNPKVADGLASQLKMKPQTPHAVLVREGLRRGYVSVENIAAGSAMDDAIFEMSINGLMPDGAMVMLNPLRDVVLGSILTGRRVAALYPEVQPLFDLAHAATSTYRAGYSAAKNWLNPLRQSVSNDAAKRGVTIIDEAGQRITASLPEDVVERSRLGTYTPEDEVMYVAAQKQATQEAIAAAQATGDESVLRFVTEATGRMDFMLDRARQSGALKGLGLIGYFPIDNVDKWRLDITGVSGDVKWAGFHPTREAARQEALRLKQAGHNITGTISAQRMAWDRTAIPYVEPAQLGRLHRSVRESLTERVEDLFEESGVLLDPRELTKDALSGVRAAAAAPKRSTGAMRQRVLGIRDYASDPFDALEMYSHSMERMLALRDFEPQARKVLDAIPGELPKLKAWGDQYVDRMMGRPDAWELGFDNMLKHLEIDVAPRALSRWLSVVRRWGAMSRLSNPFSAAVNLSQIVFSTNAVLGPADTARGLKVLMRSGAGLVKEMEENGLDSGVTLIDSDSGLQGIFGTLRDKHVRAPERFFDAAYRISMWMFNKTENINRLVTAAGAYQRSLREQAAEVAAGKLGAVSKKAAAQYAQTVLERTQFDYGTHNMPALLQGPVGGLLFQFKSFLINEIDFIASMSAEEAARFGTTVAAFGGMSLLINMPGADIVNMASGVFSDAKITEWMRMEGGERDASAAKRMLLFGLPGLFDADISDYLGVGSISELTSGIFGPAADDLSSVVKFAYNGTKDFLGTGKVTAATRQAFVAEATPTVIRRARLGWEIARTGEVRSPYTSKLIYRPEERVKAAMLTAFGPPPLELQAERAQDAVAARTREEYLRARTSYLRETAMAVIAGDAAEVQNKLREARAAGHIIDAGDLKRYVTLMRQTADERRHNRTPKALRAEAQELFDLTGLQLARP